MLLSDITDLLLCKYLNLVILEVSLETPIKHLTPTIMSYKNTPHKTPDDRIVLNRTRRQK